MEATSCVLDFLKVAVFPLPRKLQNLALQINENKISYVSVGPLASILSKKFGLKYKFLEPSNGQFRVSGQNGNWDDLIDMVHRGEADIAIAEIVITEKRAAVVNFSYPYSVSESTFITDKPRYSLDFYAILRPLSISVWLGIGVSLLLVQIVSYFLYYKNYSFQKLFFKIFGILFEVSANINYGKLSMYYLMFSWILSTFFITMAYKTVLFSFLTFPTLIGIKNIEQLAEASQKSSFKCSSYKGTSVYIDRLVSGKESWKEIGKCIMRTNRSTNHFESFLEPITYQKAFIGSKSNLELFKDDYFISDEVFWLQLVGIAYGKTFPCGKKLSRDLNWLVATGIVSKIDRDSNFFNSLLNKNVKNEETNRTRKLRLEDFALLFSILLFGYILATVVLIAEVLHGKILRHKKRTIHFTKK